MRTNHKSGFDFAAGFVLPASSGHQVSFNTTFGVCDGNYPTKFPSKPATDINAASIFKTPTNVTASL